MILAASLVATGVILFFFLRFWMWYHSPCYGTYYWDKFPSRTALYCMLTGTNLLSELQVESLDTTDPPARAHILRTVRGDGADGTCYDAEITRAEFDRFWGELASLGAFNVVGRRTPFAGEVVYFEVSGGGYPRRWMMIPRATLAEDPLWSKVADLFEKTASGREYRQTEDKGHESGDARMAMIRMAVEMGSDQ